MQVTFVSNYINHHQLPLCRELIKYYNDGFTFLATDPMPQERKNMGWEVDESTLSFVRHQYEDEEAARKLLMDSDVVIFGGTMKEELIIERLQAGKFTIRYNERLYKEGRYKFISPRGLLKKYHDHVRFRKAPVYMLCAGAYTAGDYKMIGAYPNKLLNFGYFPECIEYENVHELRMAKEGETIEVLWASRFIDWKHPKLMVQAACMLKEFESNVHVTMVGNGELLEECKGTVKEYEENNNTTVNITFIDSMKPSQMREIMRKSDIFVQTSDEGEGWGAVINEAMNSGCAVVAGFREGAAATLIKDGQNGLLFDERNFESLCRKLKLLITDTELRRRLADEGYKTIVNTWNAKVAVERLVEFISDESHSIKNYEDEGPMSPQGYESFGKVKKRYRL